MFFIMIPLGNLLMSKQVIFLFLAFLSVVYVGGAGEEARILKNILVITNSISIRIFMI